MNYRTLWVLSIAFICCLGLDFHTAAFGQKKSKKDYLITLSTSMGDMQMILYEKTPKHRENFLKLAQKGFYDDLLFHRVINEFMIQGGDPDSKNAPKGKALGSGGLDYRIPAEFDQSLFHKKGALAAARDNNPEKASSSCQFYIVQGKRFEAEQIDQLAERNGATYSDAQKEIYQTLGGTPHLDQNYTVFGEVISGLEVIDKIAKVGTDRRARPQEDISMTIKVKKMSKKKITKLYGYQYE